MCSNILSKRAHHAPPSRAPPQVHPLPVGGAAAPAFAAPIHQGTKKKPVALQASPYRSQSLTGMGNQDGRGRREERRGRRRGPALRPRAPRRPPRCQSCRGRIEVRCSPRLLITILVTHREGKAMVQGGVPPPPPEPGPAGPVGTRGANWEGVK